MDKAAYLSSTTLSNIQLVINHYCSRLNLYILYSIRSSFFHRLLSMLYMF